MDDWQIWLENEAVMLDCTTSQVEEMVELAAGVSCATGIAGAYEAMRSVIISDTFRSFISDLQTILQDAIDAMTNWWQRFSPGQIVKRRVLYSAPPQPECRWPVTYDRPRRVLESNRWF